MTIAENVERVRYAYNAYSTGDIAALLDVIDPELEWTYLDPSVTTAEPQVCHGRGELATMLGRLAARGLRPELVEIAGHGDKVLVGLHTQGLDAYRASPADDRSFDVLTLRDGQVVALRACRDRAEAVALAGIEEVPDPPNGSGP
jgi:ketosteroid isomerase-like protein